MSGGLGDPPRDPGRFKEWLWEDRQFRYLLHFALKHLGHRATPQDAEDAWAKFYHSGVDSVIRTFDPAKGHDSLPGYLLLCFKRFCWDEGKKLREWGKRKAPLPEPELGEGKAISLELVDRDPRTRPDGFVVDGERQEVLVRAINRLRPPYRIVIIMFYFEDQPVAQIAAALGISKTNVKQLLFRARQMLAGDKELADYSSEEVG